MGLSQAIEVPGIMFDNRKIFLQQHGLLDKKAPHVAGVLGKIMNERMGNIPQGPLIETPVVIGGNGDGE